MTQEEFIKELQREDYYYEYSIEGDTIVFPEGVNNVRLDMSDISSNVEFRNGGNVIINNIESVPANVTFNNGGSVFLRDAKIIDSSSTLSNGNKFWLRGISTMNFPPKIEDINDKRLLNLMIKQGVFER
jgi:hypothetical protein